MILTTSRVILSCCGFLGLTATVGAANGVGESNPYDFRSDNARQVLNNSESVRLNYLNANRGVGSSFGIGTTQTGNTTTIEITGDGDNTIDIGQENSGDQDTTGDE